MRARAVCSLPGLRKEDKKVKKRAHEMNVKLFSALSSFSRKIADAFAQVVSSSKSIPKGEHLGIPQYIRKGGKQLN